MFVMLYARVPEDMPLYDILNEFQKGHSHMAVVVSLHMPGEPLTSKSPNEESVKDVRLDIDVPKTPQEKNPKAKRSLQRWKSFPSGQQQSNRGTPRSKKWARDIFADVLQIDGHPLPKLNEEEEAVGIITMEDVIEELLQHGSNIH
ncbi:DUF21 domain-containing protein [Asimina triloba]